jgi:hypothetical protein
MIQIIPNTSKLTNEQEGADAVVSVALFCFET